MMEKQNSKGSRSFFQKIGDSFRSKGFRFGAYTTVTSILVIAAVIVINLIVSAVDIRKDLTSDGKYSLTKETEALLSGLSDELDIYYLTKENATLSWFETIFDLYQKGSREIEFKNVDMLINPKFAEQYTNEEVMQHSLIVVNKANGRSKYISYKDMLLFELSVDPNTYQYTETVTGIDVEGQINAAIQYVTSEKQTNLYAVTGHGEMALGTEGLNLLRKANINYNTFEVMKSEAVPEDCDVLYISAPTKDYTEAERKVLEDYAAAGGDFLIVAAYQSGMENFNGLLSSFGVSMREGVVLEGDPNYYFPQLPYVLLPRIITDHAIMKNYAGMEYLPMQSASALTVTAGDPAKISSAILLSTTEKSYLKTGYISTMAKEDGDKEGPFTVGLYVQNTDTKSEVMLFSTPAIFIDEYLSTDNFINAAIFTNSINYMAEAEAISTVRTISLKEDEKLVVKASQANAIAVMFVIVIPVFLLVAGISVMLYRKRR